jgi:16S rRNA pseudouridine516 synthase
MKLDRLIAKHRHLGRSAAHQLIATGQVGVNGITVKDNQHEVNRFASVLLNNEIIQQPQRALYLMLHKPSGYVSATRDAEHPTVLDLIDEADRETLHIAGRLDRSTTGLVLLTNDGRWSKAIMDAEAKVPKVYLVETAEPIESGAVEAFACGFYFHTEAITTRSAQLEILGSCLARLTLFEGRYHQVKRMIHRIGNRVVSLHRESIGTLTLPDSLCPGQWRRLTDAEVALF